MRVVPGSKAVAAGALVVLTAIGVHLGAQGQVPAYPQFQRPPADPAVIARGQALYGIRCAGCHGADLRGGDQGGPNLLRSEVVLMDQKGEGIMPIIQNGRQSPGMPGMPPVPLPPDDILAVAEYLHSVLASAGRQGRPPVSATPPVLNVLVGDIEAGRAYFNAKCSSCHSVTADLKGIATRVTDPKAAAEPLGVGRRWRSRRGRGHRLASRARDRDAGWRSTRRGPSRTDRRLHRHPRAGRWHAAHVPEKRR